MNEQINFSLLFEEEQSRDKVFHISSDTLENLNLKPIVSLIDRELGKEAGNFLAHISTDIKTIRYRQDILKDFIRYPDLLHQMEGTARRCYEIKNLIKFAFEREATLYNLLKRLEESKEVMELVETLVRSLRHLAPVSAGLRTLSELLQEIVASDLYTNYKKDLEGVSHQGSKIQSIRIGMNLDAYLKPTEAIVLSFEEKPFKYTRKMKKVNKIIDFAFHELVSLPRKIFAPDTFQVTQDLNELERVIEPAMRQLISFCDGFNDALLSLFEEMDRELSFFRAAVYIQGLIKEAGMASCLPDISESAPTEAVGLYNMHLALLGDEAQHPVVVNDYMEETGGSIFILTGPNRGGKTTYTQAVGQMYLFGLCGFHVPASLARIRVLDGLHVHFLAKEKDTMDYGRLGEECKRISDIFDRLTGRSLLLMDESFCSTSHEESMAIVRDILKAVQLTGASVLYNTHLHELAAMIPELPKIEGKPVFVSLVSGSREEHQSFKVVQGEPLGISYAKEIAEKYGVSYDLLTH